MPAPGIARTAPRQERGHPRPAATYFSSSAPARHSTGTSSSGRRSHTGGMAPWPAAAQQPRQVGRVVGEAPGPLRRDAAPATASRRRAAPPSARRPPRSDAPRSRPRAPRRAARRDARVLDAGAHADQHERRPAPGLGQRRVQHEPAAHRVARPGTAPGSGRSVRVVEKNARIAFAEPLGDRSPGVAALHEPGHEGERRPLHATSQPHLRTAAGARRRAGALRDDARGHLPGVAQRAADLRAGRDGGHRGGVGARRARGRVPGARASRRRPGGRSP